MPPNIFVRFLYVLVILCLSTPIWAKPATGEKGMVVSAHPLASEVGQAILKEGGNVVDAAIAVAFALGVVEPWSSGIGGGAFAVVHHKGKTTSFDMRERAPKAATSDMFVKDGKVEYEASTHTARAAAIPGLVRGLASLHQAQGKLPWERLVQPSIDLAEKGFAVSPRLRAALEGQATRFEGDAKAIFMPQGKLPEVGDRLIQADLGQTLRAIAETYGESFYVGETAERLVKGVKALGGIWTLEDLAEYRVAERPVVRGSFKGYDVVSMGPPSSGGLLLVQMLGVLERVGYDKLKGEAQAHVLAETMKRAFAMRAVGLADPDYVTVNERSFMGVPVITKLAKEVKSATVATPAELISNLKVNAEEKTHTTHLAVMDNQGNAVALTSTINLHFGNCQIAPGTGVVLNNEMDDFAVQPGVPNAFGLVGDSANRIEPGKRPLSSMTPTLLLKGNKAVGAFGSPGGSRIISATLQSVLNVIVGKLNAFDALAKPRLHHQWYPDVIQIDGPILDEAGLEALRARGHALREVGPMGNAMVIWKRADGVLEGAADPRGEGSASGY